jgi:hypothetical protein
MNGIHLELLKELLSSGYDCSIDTTDTVLWEPGDKSLHGFCDSRPVYNCHGECEPFLLKFLVECSKNAYGKSELFSQGVSHTLSNTCTQVFGAKPH